MKESILFLGITLGLSICVNAQNHQLNLSVTPKVWMNKQDVYHDDFNGNALSSENRKGISGELSFKKLTQSGFFYGAAADFGHYSQHISIFYPNLKGYRADGLLDNSKYLKGLESSFSYATLGFIVGYNLTLNKTNRNLVNTLSAEIGIKRMIPFKGFNIENETLFAKGSDGKELAFGNYEWADGNTGVWYMGPFLFDASLLYHFKPVKNGKTFFIGLNGTINSFFFNAPGRIGNTQSGNFVLEDYKTNLDGTKMYGTSNSRYAEVVANKYTSFGIKIGMTLF